MKKIGLLALALVLALGAMGAGFAYFSDIVNVDKTTVAAGTMDIQVSKDNVNWYDASALPGFSVSDLQPGDTCNIDIYIRNVGTSDVIYLFSTMYDYSYTGADLANVIEVVTFKEQIPGYGWIDNNPDTSASNSDNYWTKVSDLNYPLTLKELIESSWVGDSSWVDWCTGSGYDQTPGPAIIASGTYHLMLGLKFMETAGNDYQGATCSFYMRFEAVQALSQVH